jgi:resuscitation-promoting factor RpfA
VWAALAECESGGDWSINTGNGYYGGLQFLPSSWEAAGGTGMPHEASPEEQIRVAENLLEMQGWGAWPACSAELGLR